MSTVVARIKWVDPIRSALVELLEGVRLIMQSLVVAEACGLTFGMGKEVEWEEVMEGAVGCANGRRRRCASVRPREDCGDRGEICGFSISFCMDHVWCREPRYRYQQLLEIINED